MNATRFKVDGMEVGLTLSLENQQGNLKLSLLECGCYVRDISIQLNGGASWLYQGYHLCNLFLVTSRISSFARLDLRIIVNSSFILFIILNY